MIAGYWQTNYWCDDYWQDDYWQKYGAAVFIKIISLLYAEYFPIVASSNELIQMSIMDSELVGMTITAKDSV